MTDAWPLYEDIAKSNVALSSDARSLSFAQLVYSYKR
jgi:hypothetical protein